MTRSAAVPRCRSGIRVWALPVRILHWTVAAVAVLAFTGYYIGNPYIVGGDEEAFLMGTFRAVHLAAAWAFSVAIGCRVVWAFIRNHWSKCPAEAAVVSWVETFHLLQCLSCGTA